MMVPSIESPCCESRGLRKGPWTREEDLRLKEYITKHGHSCWRTLPKAAGLQRCGKSCRLRWINYLRPDLKRGNFLDAEEQLIFTLQSLLGNRWSLIAGRLPGRTDNEIKNHWNTHLKKKLRNMGIDPSKHRSVIPLHSAGTRKKFAATGASPGAATPTTKHLAAASALNKTLHKLKAQRPRVAQNVDGRIRAVLDSGDPEPMDSSFRGATENCEHHTGSGPEWLRSSPSITVDHTDLLGNNAMDTQSVDLEESHQHYLAAARNESMSDSFHSISEESGRQLDYSSTATVTNLPDYKFKSSDCPTASTFISESSTDHLDRLAASLEKSIPDDLPLTDNTLNHGFDSVASIESFLLQRSPSCHETGIDSSDYPSVSSSPCSSEEDEPVKRCTSEWNRQFSEPSIEFGHFCFDSDIPPATYVNNPSYQDDLWNFQVPDFFLQNS